ncbi:hypothetical protein [Aureimonas leprariae]|uniref:Uncharacterized protein n=1 Tax=Plantimonas leprariae TaxID=2615207 RepID=A0A7V7TWC1_9HYPH|nr:hypothetical protein [Aureimonas leprariae]KAB0679366.1 hypothetical protein F6X38_13620 [Aureimonas leprariae]
MRLGILITALGIAAGTSACAQGVGAPPMVEPLRDSDPYAGSDPNLARPSGDANGYSTNSAIQGLPPGGETPPTTTTLGGPPLDVDRVMDGVKKCWTAIPRVYGTEAQGGVARIRLKFQPNGALDGAPMIIDKPLGPIGTKFAESAAKAIERCQPYALPPERYAEWKQIEMKFDTIDPDNPPPPPPAPAVAPVPDGSGLDGAAPPVASSPDGYVPSVPAPDDGLGAGEPARPQ